MLPSLITILTQSDEESTVPAESVDEVEFGCDDGWLCDWVYDQTGNEFLADAAGFAFGRVLPALLILVGSWLVVRLVRHWIRRSTEKLKTALPASEELEDEIETQKAERSKQRAETVSTVLESVAAIVIYAIAVVWVLTLFDVPIGPLVAGLGIVGVAFGFGAQDLVKDFLSGLFMLIEDQYGVGDVVDIGEAKGTVERVTLRITTLRDIEGNVWHVPNGEISRVANKSQLWARALLDIGVAYDADLREAQRIIKEAADEVWQDDEWFDRIQQEPEVLGVEMLGDSAVTIRLSVQTTPADQFAVARVLRLRIKESLDAAGIVIPFPQQDVWLHPVEPKGSAPAEPVAGEGGSAPAANGTNREALAAAGGNLPSGDSDDGDSE